MARFSRKDIFFKDGDMAVFGDAQDSKLYWDDAQSQLTLTSTISGVYPTLDSHLATKQYVDDQITSEVLWDRTGSTIYPVTSSDIVSLGTVVTGTSTLNVYEQVNIHEFTGGTPELILDAAMLSEGGEAYISFKDEGTIVGLFRAGLDVLEFTAYSNQDRDMVIQTGNHDTTNDVYLKTGNASSGNSGNVYISTGSATGTKGSVYIDAELDMDSNKIINLPAPTSSGDAANKGYVDNVVNTSISGIDYTQSYKFSTGELQLDSSNPPSYTTVGPLAALLFDSGTDEFVFGSFVVPDSYKSDTNITLKVKAMNVSGQTGTNSCVWALDYHTYADGETYGSKTTTRVSTTESFPNNANAGTFQESSITMSYNNVNNPISAGDTVVFRFSRDANNGSDTLTGDAALLVLVFDIETEVA